MLKNKIHLITGNDQFLINEMIDQIIKASNQNDPTIKKYYLKNQWEEDKKIINIINTKNFFIKNQILIINCEMLDKSTEKFQKLWIQSLTHAQHLIILFTKVEFKANLLKKIKNIVEFWKTKKITSATRKSFIKKKFKKENIIYEDKVIPYLTDNLPNNLFFIDNELTKIKIYLKNNPQILDINLTKKIINSYPEKNIFLLLESMLLNDRKKIIENYQKIPDDLNPLQLCSVLQTYLLWIKRIDVWKKQNLTNNVILNNNVNKIFFVNKVLFLYQKKNQKYIDNLIDKIYDLEYNYKVSNISKENLLEIFLIS